MTPTAVATPSYPLTSFSSMTTTADGYSYTEVLSIGAVIPYSDQKDSVAAWKSVGARWSAPPCALSNPADLGPGFLPARQGIAYGTLKIIDNNPKFPPGSLKLAFETTNGFGVSVGWSADGDCVSDYDRSNFLSPSITTSAPIWGPVAVDIAIGDYVTPKYPNGDPSALSGYSFSPGDSSTNFTLQPFTS